jgi:hypothetical protein
MYQSYFEEVLRLQLTLRYPNILVQKSIDSQLEIVQTNSVKCHSGNKKNASDISGGKYKLPVNKEENNSPLKPDGRVWAGFPLHVPSPNT